jgi:hypothetical protein
MPATAKAIAFQGLKGLDKPMLNPQSTAMNTSNSESILTAHFNLLILIRLG